MVTKATAKISSGTIIINSAGNGIQAKKAGGNITIDGGMTTITSASAALKAKNNISILHACKLLKCYYNQEPSINALVLDGKKMRISINILKIRNDT